MLFCIQFDGQSDYVEALSMKDAIRVWQDHAAKDNDGEIFDPDSCAMITDEKVIREEATFAALTQPAGEKEG